MGDTDWWHKSKKRRIRRSGWCTGGKRLTEKKKNKQKPWGRIKKEGCFEQREHGQREKQLSCREKTNEEKRKERKLPLAA
ncbi:hypothetical protein ACFX11_027277 [Malus domestica]